MRTRSLRWKSNPGYVLILPCVIILAAMMIFPVYQTVRFSLSEVKLPNFGLSFIGLDNFRELFSRAETAAVFKNSLIWILGSVLLKFLLGLWGAIAFSTHVRGVVFFRVLCLLPWTIPSVVGSNLWRWIFQTDIGLLNGFFRWAGLGGLSHNWLGDPNTALYSVMVANAWSGFPFVMIMLLAGIQGIPKELYEAGEIDGANNVQLFRHITIPGLQSIMAIAILLQLVFNLNSFDFLYVMTGGGPGGASEILGLYIYRMGFKNLDFGMASAISVSMIGAAVLFFLLYWLLNAKNIRTTGWREKS